MKALILSAAAAILSMSLSAQSNEVFASNLRLKHCTSNCKEVRREVVNANFEPTHEGELLLMREIRRTAGGWVVKVKAADGSLRMQGTYSDEKLTVQHGTFSYYHDNGQLESEGQYVNGVKTGVWKRFDRDGKALSEKVYSGQTYEQMATSYGWKN